MQQSCECASTTCSILETLIRDLSFDALRANTAFDADWLLEDLNNRGAIAVITPKANRKSQRAYDVEIYKWRHLVEPRGGTHSLKITVDRP